MAFVKKGDTVIALRDEVWGGTNVYISKGSQYEVFEQDAFRSFYIIDDERDKLYLEKDEFEGDNPLFYVKDPRAMQETTDSTDANTDTEKAIEELTQALANMPLKVVMGAISNIMKGEF